jgi:hypothetical protein
VEIGTPTAPCVPHPKNYTGNDVWFGLVDPCTPVPFTFFSIFGFVVSAEVKGGGGESNPNILTLLYLSWVDSDLLWLAQK